ncbi:hypothetical protein N4Q71_00640, partial [Salmonella enterica subsp. enterica serovar Montevideo]
NNIICSRISNGISSYNRSLCLSEYGLKVCIPPPLTATEQITLWIASHYSNVSDSGINISSTVSHFFLFFNGVA